MLLNRRRREPQNATTVAGLSSLGLLPAPAIGGAAVAEKLSAVNRCVEILSDSMGKLPVYFLDTRTRQRVNDHPLRYVLQVRPNEAMTPFDRKKLLETDRLRGNAYEWVLRNPATGRVRELIPLPAPLVHHWRDRQGRMWYDVQHPYTGETMRLPGADVCHYKAYSRDGITGISVMERAAETIAAAAAAQQYDLAFYRNGARPDGVLTVEGDVSGNVNLSDGNGGTRTISQKEYIREEWERCYGGAGNGHRTAILDFGLKYQPIAISQKDTQFVERAELSVQDIARFFGVPLYKLQSGKQSYSSNEQNAIEYVVSTLHPTVCRYEEELCYKLLTDSELAAGLEIRLNMMAELRGDSTSRGNWYKTMREIGAYSVNDILALEDAPDVPGGDTRYASWNYGPLERWAELSVKRATKGGNGA